MPRHAACAGAHAAAAAAAAATASSAAAAPAAAGGGRGVGRLEPGVTHAALDLVRLLPLVHAAWAVDVGGAPASPQSGEYALGAARHNTTQHNTTPLCPPPCPRCSAAGTTLGYCSSVLYLTSRLSQIWKNYKRGSAEGLAISMFLTAICANTFYGGRGVETPCSGCAGAAAAHSIAAELRGCGDRSPCCIVRSCCASWPRHKRSCLLLPCLPRRLLHPHPLLHLARAALLPALAHRQPGHCGPGRSHLYAVAHAGAWQRQQRRAQGPPLG